MPGVRTRPPVRPSVRLRAVPPLDPPFDDEYGPATWVGGTVAPDAPDATDATDAADAADAADASDSPGRSGGAGGRRSSPAGPRPAPTGRLSPDALANATPEARRAAKRFLGTCLEIFNGYRPIAHVRPLSSPPEVAVVVERLTAGAARISGRRHPGRPTPVVRLRRLRVCEPRPGVAEVAAVLGTAGRTWAMAFRLERRRGSWVGISVEVL